MEYAEYYPNPDFCNDSDFGYDYEEMLEMEEMNLMQYCSDEYDEEDEEKYDGNFDQFDFRPLYKRKNRCRYCSKMFYKKCTSCPGAECRPTCVGTLVKHDCSLKFLCDVCHKRFDTKEKLEAGTHKFRQSGKVINCNDWVACDTTNGTRFYQTKERKLEVF